MSANLIVDLGGTAQTYPTIGSAGTSGGVFAASGGYIGLSVDMINSDTYCNINAIGVPFFTSGQLRVAVQTSDSDVSGTYTDPTSGLPQFPTSFQSGGILILNSGGLLGGTQSVSSVGANSGQIQSGYAFQSGFSVCAAFQRPQAGRFVRANVLSGDFFAGQLAVGVISQNKTTGSGGGFSYSPLQQGPINV